VAYTRVIARLLTLKGALAAALLFAAPAPGQLSELEGKVRSFDLSEVGTEDFGTLRIEAAEPGADLRSEPGTLHLSVEVAVGAGTIDSSAVGTNEVATGRSLALFDRLCDLTRGFIGGFVGSEVQDECVLTIFTSTTPIVEFQGQPISLAEAFTQALSGSILGEVVVAGLLNSELAAAGDLAALLEASPELARLNEDLNDGGPPSETVLCNNSIAAAFPSATCLSQQLTDAQEALIGCGLFQGTDCDVQGFDLFGSEAGALLLGFPLGDELVVPKSPACTRLVNGEVIILPGCRDVGSSSEAPGSPVSPLCTRLVEGEVVRVPGCRGPADPGYDPRVDGCVGPLPVQFDPMGACEESDELIDPRTGERFHSEMEALSFNFLQLLASVGDAFDVDDGGPDDCKPEDPLTCSSVRGLMDMTTRELADDPSGPPARRWLWESGAEFAPVADDDATGILAGFAGWTPFAVGPEVSRVPGRTFGVPLILVPPASEPAFELLPRPLGVAYAVPEPGAEALGTAALLVVLLLRFSRYRPASHRAATATLSPEARWR